MARLTKRSVDALAPAESDYTVWDDDLPGFGVRVHPGGRKTFLFKYRVGGGRGAAQRKMTIGTFGPVTVEQARGIARQGHADVVKGGDPAGQRDDHRRAATMKQFAERYLEQHARPKKKPRSALQDQRMIENHVLPQLGARKVVDITTADIAKVVNSLVDRPIMANRVRALLSKMMSLAAVWGVRRTDAVNPAKAVEKFPERRHERFLTVAELQRLGEVLRQAEQTAMEKWQAIAAIRLLLLSGCRCGEILGMRWEYVDWERNVILLPDSKTGGKSVYLSAELRALLDGLPSRAAHGYVLPGRPRGRRREQPGSAVVVERPFVGLGHVWRRIANAADLRPMPPPKRRYKVVGKEAAPQDGQRRVAPVRLHDLRHTFASKGVGLGVSLRLVGGLLGHVSPLTTDRYAHLDADPVRQAGERIATVIGAQLRGEAAAVVPMPARDQNDAIGKKQSG